MTFTQCPAEYSDGRRCCHPAGHGGCHETWTAATPPDKVDLRWWGDYRKVREQEELPT
jgi:hypothetical protein